MPEPDIARVLSRIATEAADAARTPSATEIRARGTARHRRRVAAMATGTALSTLAAFGVAVGLSGSPSSEPEPAAPLGSVQLLRVEDLEALEDPDAGWRQLPEPGKPVDCAPAAGSTGAKETYSRSFELADGYRADQIVEEFADASAAHESFGKVGAMTLDCQPWGRGLVDAWQVTGVGDEALLAQFVVSDPAPEDELIVTVAIARTGNVVTTVTTSGLQSEWGIADYDKLAAAVSRLCEPAGGRCVDSPERTRIYPEVEDVPGFLSLDDLPTLPGVEWDAGAVREPAETTNVETTCDYGYLDRSGAVHLRDRVYAGIVGDDPVAVTLSEVVADFDSAEAAASYVERHRVAYSDCPSINAEVSPVSLGTDAGEVSGWSIADIGMFVAAVQVDTTVVVLQLSDATQHADAGTFAELVSTAREGLR